VLPLLVLVIVGLLGAGMLVFWLGFSTSVSTDAQTAADAAALAAEQSVDTQWNQLIDVGGVMEPQDSYQTGPVQSAAQQWASNNNGTVVSIEYCDQTGACSPQPIETSEPDVLVTVRSNRTLPSGSVSPGSAATAQARASTNPYALASPPISESASSTCTPDGVPALPPVSAKGGPGSGPDAAGFSESADTKFGPADPCEYSLAAHLDELAKALGKPLVGVWGAGADNPAGKGKATPDAVVTAHACGAMAEVQGLPNVSDAELAKFGLASFPGQPDEIEFASPKARCQTSTTPPSQSTSDQSASVGNGKVHLVPLTGGPQGAAILSLGSEPGPAITTYLPIYERLAKQYGWDQAQVQDWLAVEQIEDAPGYLGFAPDGSGAFGLAQFQTVNYCAYGPGSCPQDNPTAEQELESMALYIHDRYGNPAAALAHELSHNPHWY
jgi:hypothetical protein